MGVLMNLLNNPVFIIYIVILFIIFFMVYLESYNQITSTFWKFGPVLNNAGQYYKYMTFTMDNWVKVISVYVIIFLTSLIGGIYDKFYKTHFIKHLESSDYSIMSRITTYLFLGINPLVDMMYYIINFFAVACFQFQYLLPLFLGAYLGEIPYILNALGNKI